ncbi:MAG: hypothetical protein KC593_16910 [Myxococcales bacterium]|nr:hypothetical protein [Myxococcales bacterium]
MSRPGSVCAEDALAPTLARLQALDAAVSRSPSGGLSLDPTSPGRRATTAHGLLLALTDAPLEERLTLGAALADVGESMLRAFPLNLFWDMDGVFAELRRASRVSLDDARALAAALAELMALFGRDSPIQFQYVHDFVYGFDWAEWVRREPSKREGVRPFDARYVARTHQRGIELLALIEADDDKYPTLPKGEFRNPFSFSRTPQQERRLFEALAAAGAIPNPAWSCDEEPCWARDFDAERETIAAELGLVRTAR